MKTDNLNHGYLSHGILAKIYRVVDFCGYRLFPKKVLNITGNRLLFINLGLIGDLILFRYVIEEFIRLDYHITILIQDKYGFVFDNIKNKPNLEFIYISDYKDKKILRGFCKLFIALKKAKTKKYHASLHFRGYLGTGILSTYLSRVSENLIGYGTSGFGFLLNKRLSWKENSHETLHLLDVLKTIKSDYTTIKLNIFANYLANSDQLLKNFGLVPKQYLVVHPTSQDRQKNLPLNILSDTLDYIINHTAYQVVFVGGIDELSLIQGDLNRYSSSRIILTHGKVSFFDIYGLVASAKAFIGIDSSIAHLVSSLELPKIIVWHSLNLKSQWLPLGDYVYILDNVEDSKSLTKFLHSKLIHS